MDQHTLYWLMFGAIGTGIGVYGLYLQHRLDEAKRQDEEESKRKHARKAGGRKRVAPHAAS